MKKLLLVLLLLALLAPGRAAAGGDCWKRLLNDYIGNGRVDGTYRASCYREAIRRIPGDLLPYSDVYDVLTRALASALRKPHQAGADVPVPPRSEPAPERRQGTTTAPGLPPESPADRITGRNVRDAGAVPVPLLVLAGLGLLFVAAGVAGTLVKRRRSE